jgi:hypothetical protein
VRRAALIAFAPIAALAVAAGPASAAPTPRLAKSVVVKPASGTVTVKPRGRGRFKLRKATAIPVGSTVDTTNGKVKLTSARNSRRTQSGTFSRGAFVVTQQHDGLTDLQLAGGDFSVCSAAHAAGKRLTAAANRRRSLFGSAHGRFRTRGRNSSATVRGTEWLTEDRCDGTVTENKSASASSKVQTETGDMLQFELDPGQTITYYCNKFTIEPDTYCIMLLAQPADGVIGGGIITQVDTPSYYFCVQAPDGSSGCSDALPLSERDADGFRQAIFVCPVRQAGQYYFAWSLDGQNLLFPSLTLTLDVAGPDVNCTTDPPTDVPIAKHLG